LTNYYSAEQVAERLGLHVRTVRNFVREGKLKAIRVGKQYRIATEDLVEMTGRPASDFEPEPILRQRHVEVSSIVEIEAISPEAAKRVGNLLMGAANSRGAGHEPLRVETIYNAERARLKIVLVGGMATNASMFKLIEIALES
jgi:excisionase family DNA binding protein